jgi:hypothetical protein
MNLRLALRRASLMALVFSAGAAAAAVGGQIASAQGKPPELVIPGQPPIKPDPKVLSGNDVGFRFDHVDRDGSAVGTLMVKVDGRWVEARFGASARRGSQ